MKDQGSCLHAVRTLSNPRWEDFAYEPLDGHHTQNWFYWLGDGYTYNEKMMTGDSMFLVTYIESIGRVSDYL